MDNHATSPIFIYMIVKDLPFERVVDVLAELPFVLAIAGKNDIFVVLCCYGPYLLVRQHICQE